MSYTEKRASLGNKARLLHFSVQKKLYLVPEAVSLDSIPGVVGVEMTWPQRGAGLAWRNGQTTAGRGQRSPATGEQE